MTVPRARTLLEHYLVGARAHAEESCGPEPHVHPGLLTHQAEAIQSLTTRLRPEHSLALLADPVGTGKTVIALSVAIRLVAEGHVDRVVVVTPNAAVQRIWRERSEYFGGRSLGASRLDVLTAGRLATKRRRLTTPTLIIVDEAHRRLRRPEVEALIGSGSHAPHRRLLLTATPFQISVQRLAELVELGDDIGTYTAVADSVREYGRALTRAAKVAPRRLTDHETTRLVSQARTWEGEQRRLMSTRPTSEVRAEIGLPSPEVPAPAPVELPARWAEAFHVARVVPELAPEGDGRSATRATDSFQRGLVSSSEAFWCSAGAKWLASEARRLERELRSALGEGDAHPKVDATARWVEEEVAAGRHVAVFCVWSATALALSDVLRERLGDEGVHRPSNSIGVDVGRRFRAPGAKPLVLVLQDRFSESIDLDGGQPSLVHHDLPWNPARLLQRWGRFVRAGTGFVPLPPEQVYVPVLRHESDERVYATVSRRAGIGEVLLSDELRPRDDADSEPVGLQAVLDALGEA